MNFVRLSVGVALVGVACGGGDGADTASQTANGLAVCMASGTAYPACDGLAHPYVVEWADQTDAGPLVVRCSANIALPPLTMMYGTCPSGAACTVVTSDSQLLDGMCR